MSKTDRPSLQGQPDPARADAIRPRARRRLATAFGILSLLLTGSAAAQAYTFKSQFPAAAAPLAVAIDPTNSDILVADGYEVQTFSSNGTDLAQFGTYGLGVGQFLGPAAVAVDPTNRNLVVADTAAANSSVQICTPAGTTWSNCSYINGIFVNPFGVAVDPVSHNVVVADTYDGVVQICTPAGTNYSYGPGYSCTAFGAGKGQTPFQSPTGVAIDPVSHFIVVVDNSASLVRIYSPTGSYLAQVGGNGQFIGPWSVAIDPKSRNIVVSQQGARPWYQIFTSAGSYLAGFSLNTEGPAVGVAIDPATDDIVTNSINSSDMVQIFAPGPSVLPTALAAPTATESLSPAIVYNTAPSTTMTITLHNPNSGMISGLAFDDVYPAGIVNASSPVVLGNSCGGTVTAAAGGSSTQLANAWLPGNSSCSVVISLVGSKPGKWVNPTGAVTSSNAQISSGASASLTVLVHLPTGGPTCPAGSTTCFN